MSQLSSKNLHLLPDISRLKRLLQSLAMLDAIICPEWDSRFYSFNINWSHNEQMGSMRNCCGDEFYALFNVHGCFIKGFDHESAMSSWSTDGQVPWAGILDGLPSEFLEAANEPPFSMDNISFCIWKLNSSETWNKGCIEYVDCEDPDGSEHLLEIFDSKPPTYKVFASDYFEVEISLDSIQAIYDHVYLTDTLVKSINPESSLSKLKDDISEIGYPCANAT